MNDRSFLDWPFFEPRTARSRHELDAWAAANIAHRARHRCRRGLPRAGARARRRGVAAPLVGGTLTAAPATRSTRARLPVARDARPALGPRRFRVRDAGPGLGRDHARMAREAQKRAYLPRVARARPSPRSRCRSPTRAPMSPRSRARRAPTATLSARRREDLDLQRRHRRLLCRVRAHRRSAGVARHLRVHRRCRDARLRDRRAHRRDRAASARAARLPRLPRCRRRSGSARRGEGFKLAMRTLDIFRTSVAAAALGFARRALDEAVARATSRPMFGQHARRLPADAGEARADGDRRRRGGAPHLPRGVAARPGRQRHARGGDGEDGRHRERAARDRRRACRSGAASASCSGQPVETAVPRDPRLAHLRRRDRSAAAHHRARAAEGGERERTA